MYFNKFNDIVSDNFIREQESNIKEQCHKDFAVLGQFCATDHYFEALIINKMLL